MRWYNYIADFFAGAFLANVVPHFVHGISGDRFPTPFAKPPGRGLSSPTVNVIWALVNLVIGFLAYRAGRVSSDSYPTLILFFAGVTVMGIILSFRYARIAHGFRLASALDVAQSSLPKPGGHRKSAAEIRDGPEILWTAALREPALGTGYCLLDPIAKGALQ